MRILAIETSCDETAISIIEGKKGLKTPSFRVLSDAMYSQIAIHKKWGGVVPNLAKRAHAKNLVPILSLVLKESGLHTKGQTTTKDSATLKKLLEREPDLYTHLSKFLAKTKIPKIDAIAVTHGPGLEPALWVGINFAKALSIVWKKPLIPVNHMEGHIWSVLIEESKTKKTNLKKIEYPALALLISGGHTELVLMKKPLQYKIIGQTRDDAVGEAFDKSARLLGLSYPGGPALSALAQKATGKNMFNLPRPMITSGDLDFSFSGLKTAVLYTIKKISKLTPSIKADLALEFEKAVTEVLLSKTLSALKKYKAKTLIIGGGVSANTRIRNEFSKTITKNYPEVALHLPIPKLTTDNAIMIAIAGYMSSQKQKPLRATNIKARGNLVLK